MTLRLGSLFSGIGGFDLGFQQAGCTVVFHSEIDPRANQVLARHWPTTPNLGDVRALTSLPTVDILAGGFPCQDISAGRDRWGATGIQGDRSGLWWHFLRLIETNRPPWVVIENVDRLRNGRGGDDLRAVVGGLQAAGYLGLGAVLDPAALGSPARRPRVFLVARRCTGDPGGVPAWQGLAGSVAYHDPGCIVWQGGGQQRPEDGGAARPTAGTYRLIAPHEWERALGYPPGWTDGHPNTIRYHQLGNSVSPLVSRWVADRILDVERGHPSTTSSF